MKRLACCWKTRLMYVSALGVSEWRFRLSLTPDPGVELAGQPFAALGVGLGCLKEVVDVIIAGTGLGLDHAMDDFVTAAAPGLQAVIQCLERFCLGWISCKTGRSLDMPFLDDLVQVALGSVLESQTAALFKEGQQSIGDDALLNSDRFEEEALPTSQLDASPGLPVTQVLGTVSVQGSGRRNGALSM